MATRTNGRAYGDAPEAAAQRERSLSRLTRCAECGAEFSRWALELHRVPDELLELARQQPDGFGRGCVPRLALGQVGIGRYDDEHDRWTATRSTVASAYQRALDDLAEGKLSFWQRANMSRLAFRFG